MKFLKAWISCFLGACANDGCISVCFALTRDAGRFLKAGYTAFGTIFSVVIFASLAWNTGAGLTR